MEQQRGTERRTRFKVLWAVWMGAGGAATFLIVYLLTGSIGWALLGLLGSGIVLNAIAQMVIQPVRAVRGTGRHE
ncbi:MAG TPA: hypothetical protein VND88_01860 [Candidatus Acidoferrales bacterium]|nr:hypothetical protein [Candidatus Acidoferrales bacterium]